MSKDVIVKTLIVAQPHVLHSYRMCRPSAPVGSDSVCFEVLGFDVLLDRKMRPWLLEVISFSLILLLLKPLYDCGTTWSAVHVVPCVTCYTAIANYIRLHIGPFLLIHFNTKSSTLVNYNIVHHFTPPRSTTLHFTVLRATLHTAHCCTAYATPNQTTVQLHHYTIIH